MTRGMQKLVAGARELGLEIEGGMQERFQIYAELIRSWNRRINLVRLQDEENLFCRHFLDSLWCSRGCELVAVERLLDIGSGAGFPAVPLKICFPHLQVVMVESQAKRCRFLEEVIDALRLEGCRVIWERSENLARDPNHRETYDCVTARALAALPVVLELGVPFLKRGGHLLAMKGRHLQEELGQSAFAMSVLGVRLERIVPYVFEGEEGRHIVSFVKEEPTPEDYPRRAGIPDKRPLLGRGIGGDAVEKKMQCNARTKGDGVGNDLRRGPQG